MTTILSCAADVAAPQANLRLNPFAANNTHAYCLRSERLSREWRAREQIALCSGDSISGAAAVAAGVRYNSLGVSFASHRQPPSSVVELLLSGTRASQRTTGRIILDADAAPRRRHKDAASSLALGLKPEVKQLINHGYVTFNHTWGLRKAFGSALKEGVRLALSNHSRTEVFGGVSKYQALHGLGAPQVPGLDALEKRAVPRMLALATAYLGNDTVYSGYTVLRMASHDIPVKDYISGLWHHDRCGRRIKCFVFLTNTTARAHPLRIALGSHRTIFYSYDSFEESRFADEYVRREYKVKDLLGSRGDGFCFDTNSIHAGTLNGSRTRGAVVFEFNQYAKSVGLSSLDSPCRVVPTSKGWTPT